MLTALGNASGVYEGILPALLAIEAALNGRIAAGLVAGLDGTRLTRRRLASIVV
ncbi:hypothetical protein ACFQY5_39250 [Paeniroseomonas aquatica]|uniref:Uncharacterized protein n=1 Tax=Paeniroseomonas aquatica TaxID=373043 RepID=A0ABT7ZZH5_9PROT|nr:hypothetical protein [Paeniroseomonas aquatica]MDN3562863.1 hypothetical protein [Paeniroseomonas aquatica]